MSKLVICFIGVVLFSLVYAGALWSSIGPIETDIATRTDKLLQQKGHDWVRVGVNGRDVILKTGTIAQDEVTAAAVVTMVGQMRGVHAVEDLIEREKLEIAGADSQSDENNASVETVLSTTKALQSNSSDAADRQNSATEEVANEQQDVVEPSSRSNVSAQSADATSSNEATSVSAKVVATIANEIENNGAPEPDVVNQNSQQVASIDLNRKLASSEDCQKIFNRELENKTIQFASGSSAINRSSYPQLTRLAKIARACTKFRIEVGGHTDDSGKRSDNIRLSRLRAESVVTFLIQHKVDPNRLIAKGYGSARPVADNTTTTGRAKNRRIEFIIKI